MWHAILPASVLLLAIRLAVANLQACIRRLECTCIGDHFQTARTERVRDCGVRAASGSGFPLVFLFSLGGGGGAWSRTLAVYEDVCSLSVCSQQDRVVVDLGPGETGQVVHRFQKLSVVLAMRGERGPWPVHGCEHILTVFVMPSVNRTNSIVSLVSSHSGRSASMRLRADFSESELS